jgi:hypothetical protein
MWIKRKTCELTQAKRDRKREKIKSAIIFAIIVSVPLIFVFGTKGALDQGSFLVPLAKIPFRFPFIIMFGVFLGLIRYFLPGKPVVVCPKCGVTKYLDNFQQCACGGHFENIEEMKWIDERANSKNK